jgi:Fur family ferric uptake transcriptional regulator
MAGMSHHHWDYTALMRERGFRVTPQRRLILDVVCECGGHCTPEDIFARVRVKAPVLNRATVYRSLDFLCELRLVVAAEIGGGRKVYELAGETPHHHLVCRTCGQVEQLDHAMAKTLFNRIAREKCFTVDMEHMALFGLCSKCRRARDSQPTLRLRPAAD